jgi:hypothetical protein
LPFKGSFRGKNHIQRHSAAQPGASWPNAITIR